MNINETKLLTIKVNKIERDKFKLLSFIYNKSVSQLLKDLVDSELKDKKLTPTQIRQLPKDLRSSYLKSLTEEAMPYYNKYKNELMVEEIMDGIE